LHIKCLGGGAWRLCKREDVTCQPETRDLSSDMRSGHCNSDSRSSGRREISPRQHHRDHHGMFGRADSIKVRIIDLQMYFQQPGKVVLSVLIFNSYR